MKDLLKTLISYQTVSADKEANIQALNFIADYFETRGMFVARHEWNGYGSFVATTRQTKKPHILLAAHLDVVPAEPQAFRLNEENGKLYGAGVCDMKFAIASYMQLVDDLQGQLENYDFGIMITTDEEIGGLDGVKKLLHEGYSAEVCVLPDGGEDWALEVAAKGVIWATITAQGKTTHASRPWEGENAIDKMMLFLHALEREMFAAQTPDTSTCNVGMITGGAAPNQVAGSCQARIDIRPITPAEQHHILGRMAELAVQYDVNCEIVLNDPAIDIDLSHPLVAAFVGHIERVIGQPIRTFHSHGSSDARFFAAHNIPTLVTYPIGGDRHGGREWIEEKSLYQFHDILRGFVEETARLTASGKESAPVLTSTQ